MRKQKNNPKGCRKKIPKFVVKKIRLIIFKFKNIIHFILGL